MVSPELDVMMSLSLDGTTVVTFILSDRMYSWPVSQWTGIHRESHNGTDPDMNMNILILLFKTFWSEVLILKKCMQPEGSAVVI